MIVVLIRSLHYVPCYSNQIFGFSGTDNTTGFLRTYQQNFKGQSMYSMYRVSLSFNFLERFYVRKKIGRDCHIPFHHFIILSSYCSAPSINPAVHFASTFWNTKNVKYSGCFGFATGQIADCDIGLSICPSLGGSIFTG